MAGDDKSMKAVLKASEKRTVYLFTAFKHPIWTLVDSNPSILGVAESVGWLPGITNGKDYHFHSKKLLEQSQVPFTFPKEVYAEMLGGKDFYVLETELKVGLNRIRQKYYSTKIKNHILTIIVSFGDETEEKEVNEVLTKVSIGNHR